QHHGYGVDVLTAQANPLWPEKFSLGHLGQVVRLAQGLPKQSEDAWVSLVDVLAEQALAWMDGSGRSYHVIHSHYWISGLVAERTYEGVLIAPRRPGEPCRPGGPHRPAPARAEGAEGFSPLVVPGLTRLDGPGPGLIVEAGLLDAAARGGPGPARDRGGEMPLFTAAALFDYNKVKDRLAFRYRRPGDRFEPEGMEGSKSVSDFFIDEKVPRSERERIPLVEAGGGIAWIVGWRLDRRFAPGPGTDRLLELRVRSLDGGPLPFPVKCGA
ncbi:MAG: tRNA lysidine(34) synthetase TilS, partial [Actinobacteria bacterium]|nr:tRNA lysidine(34) synthetase TilS [Actinomycetota bacterium]